MTALTGGRNIPEGVVMIQVRFTYLSLCYYDSGSTLICPRAVMTRVRITPLSLFCYDTGSMLQFDLAKSKRGGDRVFKQGGGRKM